MIHAVLKVIGGKQDGKLIPLTTKKFLIGREQDCHLRPNSDSVSRHHCVITLDDFVAQVRDLGSSNGTFLNGVRVLGVQVANSGDRLKIGTLEFEVVCNAKTPVAANSAEPKSSGTQFSLDEFGLEEAPPVPVLDTSMVAASTSDTAIVNVMSEPSDEPATTDSLDRAFADASETASDDTDQLPLAAENPVDAGGALPVDPGQNFGMPATMPGGAMPNMGGFSGYGQPPQAYPGYGMQMPQPGYPYGMPQQPFPGYGMPQPGYGMPQMPMYGAMPGAMPYGQPGYPQQMPYGAYPQMQAQPMMPQAMPQMAPQPEAAAPTVEAPKAAVDALPMRLPPPEETGAKVPVVDPNKPADAPKPVAPNPAAEVLKKYMNRR